MGLLGMTALVVLAGFAPLPPAMAQISAQQVVVAEGDAPGDYRALGAVSVKVQPKSIFPKTSAKQQLRMGGRRRDPGEICDGQRHDVEVRQQGRRHRRAVRIGRLTHN
jgi:hypothetical protein